MQALFMTNWSEMVFALFSALAPIDGCRASIYQQSLSCMSV
jgi:hypothetical protein